jgi:hypothetical protein
MSPSVNGGIIKSVEITFGLDNSLRLLASCPAIEIDEFFSVSN